VFPIRLLLIGTDRSLRETRGCVCRKRKEKGKSEMRKERKRGGHVWVVEDETPTNITSKLLGR
jgi:hypothetical protein